MRKNFGVQTWFYPLPVLIVGSYDEEGKADAMNAAWGGIYERNQVMLCLSTGHKTTDNIRKKGAFTVSFAGTDHMVEADYVGIVSANTQQDKAERAGLHAAKSEFVDAPVFAEFPMTLDCRLIKFNEDGIIVGEIVNVSAEERILGTDGTISLKKLAPITFDPVHNTYVKLGETVGKAFHDGAVLKDKQE